jgi:hypothetical protein
MFLKLTWLALCFALTPALARGEVLYNGIRLTPPWPPRDEVLTLEPPVAAYLASPPEVIPIDVGRQLFVDDFLIERTTLRRTFHEATYHTHNPVLAPDRPWEQEKYPTAMVFSDGVWYDPAERLFKMWYMGGYCAHTCYATSKDGIHWEKPDLDVRPGSNIVDPSSRDSTLVWLDLQEQDPARRYKFIRSAFDGKWLLTLHFSNDGIHWGQAVSRREIRGDRNTLFYNPFRQRWVFSIREGAAFGGQPSEVRCRRYWDDLDVIKAARWPEKEAPLWIGADRLDPRRPELGVQPQLYNLDCVAYESLILGLFDIWPGQPKNRPKPNYLALGFSRDGYHWDRPTHQPFIPVSERKGDWNWGNVQSAGGGCLVVGDKLYFYVSGRAGEEGSGASGVSSTGLATLRRDGFASLDAADDEGTVTTRPVSFRGKHLFVNVDAKRGELRAEVLDNAGQVIAPFTRAKSKPVRADATLHAVSWGKGRDLAALAGKPVRFRFYLKRAQLYSFWVSPEASGASHGFVAAGGPGFTSPTDTIGRR